MTEKQRILFLSANPWTTSRILVDEEAREVFEKLQEGPYRDNFELHRHAATRPMDLQRLLMMHEPHIVHFSGHGSKQQKIILGGRPGGGKQIDPDGLVQLFALYKSHVRLVVLNACFTRTQAQSLSEVIDYSVGAGQAIGDKEGVAFAGAFYRALGFGKSVKAAFESAKAELALVRMPRAKGLDLFIRNGVNETDSFPNPVRDFSRDEVEAETRAAGLSARPSSDDDTMQRGSAALHEERTEIVEPDIAIVETPSTGPSSKLIDEEARQNCEPALVSPMRKKTGAPAQSLTRFGDTLSWAVLSNLRKGVKRVRSSQVENATQSRSATSHSRTYVVVTIEVHQVAMSESARVRQTRAVRRDQAGRMRTSLANKKLTAKKRLDIGGSD